MNTYKAASGAQYSNDQAQLIGEHLETLAEVTSEAIVEDAANELSPLHDFFEWDDSAAARAHRLSQARGLVNHLRIVVQTASGEIETKAFHNVLIRIDEQCEADPFRIYASVSEVQTNDEMREQVIQNAVKELKRWQAKYSQYRDVFGKVFAAIEKADQKTKRETAIA